MVLVMHDLGIVCIGNVQGGPQVPTIYVSYVSNISMCSSSFLLHNLMQRHVLCDIFLNNAVVIVPNAAVTVAFN